MKRRCLLLAGVGGVCVHGMARAQAPAAAAASAPPAPSAPPAAPAVPPLKSLGNERYQVGRIIVDKRAGVVTVPGRVRNLDKPLEYLATTPSARKAYETLLELDANGTELNLACILAGFERDPAAPPTKPLAVSKIEGQRVALTVAWGTGAQRQRMSAAEALFGTEATGRGKSLDWMYTGSFTSTDGRRIAADVTGTLVSFVKKDLTGIIEVVSDAVIGPYGEIRGNTKLPAEGSAIELIIEPVKGAK